MMDFNHRELEEFDFIQITTDAKKSGGFGKKHTTYAHLLALRRVLISGQLGVEVGAMRWGGTSLHHALYPPVGKHVRLSAGIRLCVALTSLLCI